MGRNLTGEIFSEVEENNELLKVIDVARKGNAF